MVINLSDIGTKIDNLNYYKIRLFLSFDIPDAKNILFFFVLYLGITSIQNYYRYTIIIFLFVVCLQNYFSKKYCNNIYYIYT